MNKEIIKIVDNVLSEEISNNILNFKNKIFEDVKMKKQICSECGSKNIYENECKECGSIYEVTNNEKEYNNKSKEVMELGGMDDGHPRFGKKRLPKKMSQEEVDDLLRGDYNDSDDNENDYRDLSMYNPYYDDNLDDNHMDDNLNENFFKKFIDRLKGKTPKKIEKSEYDGLTDEQAKRLYNDANKILNKELNNGSNDDNLSAFYRLSMANQTIKGLKQHFPNINFNDDKSGFEKIDEYDMNEGVYPEMRKEYDPESRNTHNQTKDDEIVHYWKDSGRHTLKGKRDGDKFNAHSYETDSSDEKTKKWYQDNFDKIKNISSYYKTNDDGFFLPGFGKISTYTPNEGELDEKLYGNQSRIDRNKNNRIDREDFKMLRSKKSNVDDKIYEIDFEEDDCEVGEGNAFGYEVTKAKKLGKEKFNFGGKSYNVKESYLYEVHLNNSTNEKFIFNENEILEIIEKIVNEEKNKSKSIITKKTFKYPLINSKSENNDYIKSVNKKIKEYLKDMSKLNYDPNPNGFPKGNYDINNRKEKIKKYIPSDAVDEYIDAFSYPGMTNLVFDEIEPNKDMIKKYLKGDSTTGNAQTDENGQPLGNVVPSEVGDKFYKNYTNNFYGQEQNKASYKRQSQPVDISGENTKKTKSKLNKNKKTSSDVLNSVDESIKNKKVISEMNKIQNLINYKDKTQ